MAIMMGIIRLDDSFQVELPTTSVAALMLAR
jgi:hypothetical protein